MKIRTCFVSNSSSSSFCVVTTKENHERAMAELTKFEKKVVSLIMTEGTFDGTEVMIGMTFSDNGGYGTFMDIEEEIGSADEENEDDECAVYSAWEKYNGIIEQKKNLVVNTENC